MENTNNNEQNKTSTQQQDWWDRKIDGLGKIFALTERNPFALLLIISVVCNVWLGHQLINTNQELYGQITEEVRKQAPAIMTIEAQKQLSEPKAKIDTLTQEVKDALHKILKDENEI